MGFFKSAQDALESSQKKDAPPHEHKGYEADNCPRCGTAQERLPNFGDGGVVKATPGGTDVTVAEAGQDEAIIPLPDDEIPEEETAQVDPHDEQVAALQAQLAEANTRADLLGQALFSARVSATDLLGDPASMPYSPDLVDVDDDALTAAVLALIASDPTLGKLSVTGDIDQGSSDPPATPGVSLLNILKEAI